MIWLAWIAFALGLGLLGLVLLQWVMDKVDKRTPKYLNVWRNRP